MTSTQVWHGTLTSGIKSFRSLSHFGTQLQAHRIIAASAALDEKDGEPVIYECTLSYDENELKHVDDIGSPNAQAIFLTYCNAIEKHKIFRAQHRDAINNDLDPNDPKWLVWINDLAKANGHRLLSYNNNVEGKGLSYCVIDPQTISGVKSVSLTWEKFAALYKSGSNFPHGFTEQESEEIKNFLAKVPLRESSNISQ